MTDEIVLIVNPRSRGGRAWRQANPVLRALREQGYQVQARRAGSRTATRAFVAGLPEGTVVAALGGDGFLNNVMNGCLESEAVLLPLPGGSGNDFCRSLGLSANPVKVAAGLSGYRPRRIDVGVVNGMPYLGTAAIGFTGYVNQLANESPFSHQFIYALQGLKLLFNYRCLHLDVSWEAVETQSGYSAEPFFDAGQGGSLREELFMVEVGNSGRYGGGFISSPLADMGDKRLDLVVWKEPPLHRVPALIARLKKGQHLGDTLVRTVQSQRVTISPVGPSAGKLIPVMCDGERFCDLPASFDVRPAAVTVLAP